MKGSRVGNMAARSPLYTRFPVPVASLERLAVADSKFHRTVRSQRVFMSQKFRFVHHWEFYVSQVASLWVR
jgi:hypothetical protein